jgi:UPF0716 protein FxsA
MPVLLLFVLWPLGEIAAFAMVGDRVGALNTVALVILSGLVGLAVLRRQGLAAMGALRGDGPPPAGQVLDGLAVALAGVLLIVPGFLSDAVGLLLLVPGVRQSLGALLARQISRAGGEMRFRAGVRPETGPMGARAASHAEVIDVDFTEVKIEPAPSDRRLEDHRP